FVLFRGAEDRAEKGADQRAGGDADDSVVEQAGYERHIQLSSRIERQAGAQSQRGPGQGAGYRAADGGRQRRGAGDGAELRGALPFVDLHAQGRRFARVDADRAQTIEQFFGPLFHLVQGHKPDVLFAQFALLVCHRHLAPTRAIISPASWGRVSQSYCEAHVVSTGVARFVKRRGYVVSIVVARFLKRRESAQVARRGAGKKKK